MSLQAAMRARNAQGDSTVGRPLIPYLFTHRHYRHAQEDADEFILRLVDGSPTLEALFLGRFENAQLRCERCLAETAVAFDERDNLFTVLNVSLRASTTSPSFASVQAALDAHLAPADVDENFVWTCPACQDTRPPKKAAFL